jgi:hypothetical protein
MARPTADRVSGGKERWSERAPTAELTKCQRRSGNELGMEPATASNTSVGRKPTDLYILGAGVSFPEHITVQTLRILNLCKRICSNLPQVELDKFPENLRAKCTSLWPLYQEDRTRSDNYNDVAEAVLAATASDRPVAWLTPGHPLIFDSVSQTLLQNGPRRGFRVDVGPAISCIDTIMSQLGYDPANGLLIQDATSVVMRNLPLTPSSALLLFQPSAFGSPLTHYESDWSADLSPLRDYLCRFYPPHHPCAFVRSFSPQGGPAQVNWCAIGEITAAPFEVVAGTTLFVPALGAAPAVTAGARSPAVAEPSPR